MDSDTRAAAEQALSQAFEADSPAETTSQEQAPVSQPDAASEVDTGTATEQAKPTGLFYDVDPNTLTPDMRRMFDGMQKSYTERMQETAPLRKAVDSFGGIDQVQDALGFVEALQDPQNLVQLHSELSGYLQENGLTREEADDEAARAVQEQAHTQPDDEDFGFDDPRDQAVQRELEELRQWREQIEEERLQAQVELQLERAESAIRNANPSYGDDDIERIYRLSYAFGGDLNAAQNTYEEDRKALLSSYLQSKESVPVSTAPPTAAGGGQESDSFGSSFEDAHSYAKRVLAARQNSGEFG